MERAFEKAFARCHSTVNKHLPQDPGATAAALAQSEEERLRAATAPMSAADAAARITLAFKDGDYFRLLQLPRPEADALGRPVWSCSEADVARAYRRLSVFVHPDKVQGDAAAREAFEHLNQAYRELRDANKLEEILRKAAAAARADRERREAAASAAERLELHARAAEQLKELRQEEARSFAGEVAAQMAKRKEEAERRKRAAAGGAYRRRQREDGDEGGSGDGEEDGGGGGGAEGRGGGGGEARGGGGSGAKPSGGGGDKGSDDEDDGAWRRQQRKANTKRKKVFI